MDGTLAIVARERVKSALKGSIIDMVAENNL
jgi:hypothetical protein